MRTVKLTLSYDGSRFVGWQRQAEGVSIQGLLEDALARFEGRPVTVHGAGRTDAGVHALGQVATATVESTHAVESLLRGLNASLPPEVRVIGVEDVQTDFHARFSARSKTYRYLIRNAPVVSPFDRAYVWHVPGPLDVEAMRGAAAALVGTHDFVAFMSAGSEVRSTSRTIMASDISVHAAVSIVSAVELDQSAAAARQGALLVYEVRADGFLRHMVRAIVGTLVEIGQGLRDAGSMGALLAGGHRADAGATAPPQGLFLVRVDYH